MACVDVSLAAQCIVSSSDKSWEFDFRWYIHGAAIWTIQDCSDILPLWHCGKSVCCVVCSKHPINLFWCCFLWIDWSYASALARNWNLYTSKVSALVIILTISTVNFLIGFLPYTDNFANIGGFISGFLLGFVLLFTPQLRQDPPPHKGKLFEDDMRSSTRLKEMFDRPVLRIVCLVLFCGILAGVLIAACWGVNLNRHCNWCRYVDCVPTRKWSCSDMTTSCEEMVSDAQLTLTCMANGKFRIFPYTNISQARTQDLCTLVCT